MYSNPYLYELLLVQLMIWKVQLMIWKYNYICSMHNIYKYRSLKAIGESRLGESRPGESCAGCRASESRPGESPSGRIPLGSNPVPGESRSGRIPFRAKSLRAMRIPAGRIPCRHKSRTTPQIGRAIQKYRSLRVQPNSKGSCARGSQPNIRSKQKRTNPVVHCVRLAAGPHSTIFPWSHVPKEHARRGHQRQP
jgi:hypothetical protein